MPITIDTTTYNIPAVYISVLECLPLYYIAGLTITKVYNHQPKLTVSTDEIGDIEFLGKPGDYHVINEKYINNQLEQHRLNKPVDYIGDKCSNSVTYGKFKKFIKQLTDIMGKTVQDLEIHNYKSADVYTFNVKNLPGNVDKFAINISIKEDSIIMIENNPDERWSTNLKRVNKPIQGVIKYTEKYYSQPHDFSFYDLFMNLVAVPSPVDIISTDDLVNMLASRIIDDYSDDSVETYNWDDAMAKIKNTITFMKNMRVTQREHQSWSDKLKSMEAKLAKMKVSS